MPTKERILIVDGLNNFIRNWCKNPTMDANGDPIGGIIGFLRTLKSIMRDVRPTRVVVAWDGKGGSAKRRGIYSEYKAGRKPRVNREYGELESVDASKLNLQTQYTKLREYLTYLGVAQVEVENCEADDVIGYLCTGIFPDVDKVIVSTDRDFLQLVDGRCAVWSPTTKTLYTSKKFVEQVGVRAENFIYVKAILGDGSDNIKGVVESKGLKGLGEKTLVKFFPFLAERPTNLEELRKAAEALVPKGKREKDLLRALLDGWEVISSNLALMQLRSPIISAQSVRAIRYALRPEATTFNFSDLKMVLLKEGVQVTDVDFFSSFGEYKLRYQRGDTRDVE